MTATISKSYRELSLQQGASKERCWGVGAGLGNEVVPEITAQPTPQGLYAGNTAGEKTGESTLALTGQTTAGPTTVQGSKHL